MINIQEHLLSINEYSRPGKPLKSVQGIAIHWTANPGTSAMANRNFFEARKDGKSGYGSAHYIIDIDGSIIQAIPENEMAYHVGAKQYTPLARRLFGSYPNNCLLGFELCHPDWSGEFTSETLKSAASLSARICRCYDLDPESRNVTHSDIVGVDYKECPRWFVRNPENFEIFKRKVQNEIIVRS